LDFRLKKGCTDVSFAVRQRLGNGGELSVTLIIADDTIHEAMAAGLLERKESLK
jgi:hypothetical protein